MNELLDAGLLNGDCITITGKTVAQNLAGLPPLRTDHLPRLDGVRGARGRRPWRARAVSWAARTALPHLSAVSWAPRSLLPRGCPVLCV
jgi:hypothetical protein